MSQDIDSSQLSDEEKNVYKREILDKQEGFLDELVETYGETGITIVQAEQYLDLQLTTSQTLYHLYPATYESDYKDIENALKAYQSGNRLPALQILFESAMIRDFPSRKQASNTLMACADSLVLEEPLFALSDEGVDPLGVYFETLEHLDEDDSLLFGIKEALQAAICYNLVKHHPDLLTDKQIQYLDNLLGNVDEEEEEDSLEEVISIDDLLEFCEVEYEERGRFLTNSFRYAHALQRSYIGQPEVEIGDIIQLLHAEGRVISNLYSEGDTRLSRAQEILVAYAGIMDDRATPFFIFYQKSINDYEFESLATVWLSCCTTLEAMPFFNTPELYEKHGNAVRRRIEQSKDRVQRAIYQALDLAIKKNYAIFSLNDFEEAKQIHLELVKLRLETIAMINSDAAED